MKKNTVKSLRDMKARGEKIAVLTGYDASFARMMDDAGVDVILVGDSLGMVVQGQDSTVPVTVDQMVYHTQIVRRGARNAFVVADMPFMSYYDTQSAMHNAARLMAEGGASMVKLEGGEAVFEIIRALSQFGVPVCAHLGLLPQSVNKTGGYFVQGKEQSAAQAMLQHALAVEKAGAEMLVLECVPTSLAQQISGKLSIPVIGIGAGVHCDGQVLVLYDMLGMTAGKLPRFVKNFMDGECTLSAAIAAYVAAVKSKAFPLPEHSYS